MVLLYLAPESVLGRALRTLATPGQHCELTQATAGSAARELASVPLELARCRSVARGLAGSRRYGAGAPSPASDPRVAAAFLSGSRIVRDAARRD